MIKLHFQDLCELQFDENPRFRNSLFEAFGKDDMAEKLRLSPFGSDIDGLDVWFQQVRT